MFKDQKTTAMQPDEPKMKIKQWYAFPDIGDIPAFSCEAEDGHEARRRYEDFKKTLTK